MATGRLKERNGVKGAIAAGHIETAKAAEVILREGGNAFDAVVAAHLAACVAEPVLSSPGGGGFLLARTEKGEEIAYDFFAQTPMSFRSETEFYPIHADFGSAKQEFYIGAGAAATPGTIRGIGAIGDDLCTMPLHRLVEPAVELARRGVVLNALQSKILDVVKPIYLACEESRRIFGSKKKKGKVLQTGEALKFPEMADFFERLGRNGIDDFYLGETAHQISALCREKGGHLTLEDLKDYRVIKRKPLSVEYRNTRIILNPPPGSGGILTAFALKLLEDYDVSAFSRGTTEWLRLLTGIQAATEKARVDRVTDLYDAGNRLDPEFLQRYKAEVKPHRFFPGGTTHISIIDSKGNVASLTTSNGEGCGRMIPGTGCMLNNMLGEEDINPEGFGAWPSGKRMTSMMTPGVLFPREGGCVAFGSGGSSRIRTAILQVLVNLTDYQMSLPKAIRAPRIHYEKNFLHVEYGFDEEVRRKLQNLFPECKLWDEKNLFFGGVHAVKTSGTAASGFGGFGDPRRGGVALVVE